MTECSIILPVYNEVNVLKKSIKKIVHEISKITNDYEIVIAEDGSTDGTAQLARQIASKNRKIIHLHSDKRLGKGGSLTKTIRKVNGDIVVVMDIDLSSKLEYLKKLIENIKLGADISLGSRLMRGSYVRRNLKREIMSRSYNFLIHLFFNSSVHDHQCGFKAFKKVKVLPLISKIEDKKWFWDTELLVRAQQNDLKIVEFPIEWEESRSSKINLKRDVITISKSLFIFWWKFKKVNISIVLTFIMNGTI